LQLAALSLSGRNDPSVFLSALKGDHQYIADYLTEEVLNRQPGQLRHFLLQTSIPERLCGVLLMRGKLKQATDVYRRLLDHAIDNGIEQMGIVGSLYSNLRMIFCEWDDLDEGIRLIKKGVELSKSGRDPVILASCQIILMKAFLYRMDFANAVNMMEKINECAGHFILPPWITNTVSALIVYIWLATGDMNSALNWVDERKLSIDDTIQSLRELEYLSFAHILFFQQRLDDADGLLQPLIENAAIGDRVYLIVKMRLCRVLILTKNINSKLDVNGRTKAVARTKALELL
jgi:ATP/maltotriose-dependent transcriptional regulator MalT